MEPSSSPNNYLPESLARRVGFPHRGPWNHAQWIRTRTVAEVNAELALAIRPQGGCAGKSLDSGWRQQVRSHAVWCFLSVSWQLFSKNLESLSACLLHCPLPCSLCLYIVKLESWRYVPMWCHVTGWEASAPWDLGVSAVIIQLKIHVGVVCTSKVLNKKSLILDKCQFFFHIGQQPWKLF